MSTYTLAPYWDARWSDDNNAPLNAGLIYTVAAGGTYPGDAIATYSDTSGTLNANPVVLDATGRPTSGAIFLTVGVSYKFILKTSAGATVKTIDSISAVPQTASGLDITVTAGEALSAGQPAYISDGSNSLTAGRAYKADADFPYASSLAVTVGMVVNDIASAASGLLRVGGSFPTTGLVAGTAYYVSATAGAVTSTPPSNTRLVGVASSSTTLLLTSVPRLTTQPRGPQGRLTLTSGTAVTTADVTAATTLYFTPYQGSRIQLYDGTAWGDYPLTEISIAVPATTATVYDVWCYLVAGVPTLELLAWTNATTRATALTKQDGLYVKTGALTRLYLGSFRTTGSSGQTEDSVTKRFVWNYYHRVPRGVRVVITTGYSYGTNTIRQANGATTSQVEIVTGVAENAISLAIDQGITPGAGTVIAVFGFGIDSTTTFDTTNGILSSNKATGTGTSFQSRATWQGVPTVGYHQYSWNEVETQASGATFASQQYTAQAAGINGLSWG